MNLTRSNVRWTEASTLASPDGVTMRAEMTVPSLAMVTLTLCSPPRRWRYCPARSRPCINAFHGGRVTRVGHAAVARHVNHRGRREIVFQFPQGFADGPGPGGIIGTRRHFGGVTRHKLRADLGLWFWSVGVGAFSVSLTTSFGGSTFGVTGAGG